LNDHETVVPFLSVKIEPQISVIKCFCWSNIFSLKVIFYCCSILDFFEVSQETSLVDKNILKLFLVHMLIVSVDWNSFFILCLFLLPFLYLEWSVKPRKLLPWLSPYRYCFRSFWNIYYLQTAQHKIHINICFI